MGIFESIKSAFGSRDESEADVTTSPSEMLRSAGLDPSGLQFGFGTSTITVSGEIAHENDRQKILDILATAPGINSVQDRMQVAAAPVDAVTQQPETAERGAPETEVTPDLSEAAAHGAQTTYTVQPGDTLWKIADDHYGDGSRYMQIFEANSGLLDNPDQIFPGQKLVIPEQED